MIRTSSTLEPDLGAKVPRWALLWAIGLAIATVGVYASDGIPWLGSDDASYHSAAEHLLTGTPIQRVHHQFGRMSMIVPIAVSMRLFGETPMALALPTIVASTACLLLIVVLGKMLWGWWEGLFAATVVAILPYFRYHATTILPDAHACFWGTLAVILALLATRSIRWRNITLLAIGAGLSIGLATSAKIFSITALVGVGAIFLADQAHTWRRRCALVSLIGVGCFLLFLLDGLFYLMVADDFFYKIHALRETQEAVKQYAANSAFDPAHYVASSWDRAVLFFRPSTSRWGPMAMLFWPAAMWTLLYRSKGRAIACWAMGAYLLIAYAPVEFKNGLRPYPYFSGRPVLMTCVPFALCLGWVTHRVLAGLLTEKWARRCGMGIIASVFWVSASYQWTLSGLRNPHHRRIGTAIEKIVAGREWDDQREIFVHPSIYIRHRILFPEKLRNRLRVAVAQDAPSWWRYATVDIESRRRPLPSPDSAYLIATPAQLRGEPELWDYQVRLPQRSLALWRESTPLLRVARFENRLIEPIEEGDGSDAKVLAILLGPPAESKTVVVAGQVPAR